MIRKLLNKYRAWKYIRSQRQQVFKDGSLLNAFYKSKTIFIHIPKTAGVSLLRSIYGDVTLTGHRTYHFNSLVLHSKKIDYFSFSFVRNPYDRLYSTYMFLSNGGMNRHDMLVFDNHLSKYKDFEDFVLNGLNQKLINQITHLIPQYQYICDSEGSVLVDFVGTFENLENDVKLLSEQLKKEIKLPHYNFNKKKNYREVYTKEMINRVSQLYQKDIDIFGYTF